MIKFFDIYLKTKNNLKLEQIHEIEHKIFLIPELAKIYNETNALTNWMSYSRWIRFWMVTNNNKKLEEFKNFFLKLENLELPEWNQEEKSRFEAEEKEWLIRQRQYFGSFATKIFEDEFDKINKIQKIKIDKNILKNDFFSEIRFCENYKITEIKKSEKQNFIFPKINKTIKWQENWNMFAIILPILKENYQNFIFFVEWIKLVLEKNLVHTGKIYDLDNFNVYEADYILWVIHFYSPEKIQDILEILKEKPKKSDFEFIKKILIFWIDRQKVYFDQEANVVMNFTPKQEKTMIKNTIFENFISEYDNFLNILSFVKKES